MRNGTLLLRILFLGSFVCSFFWIVNKLSIDYGIRYCWFIG